MQRSLRSLAGPALIVIGLVLVVSVSPALAQAPAKSFEVGVEVRKTQGRGEPDDGLAFTGLPLWPLLLAAGLGLAGTGAIVASRRRAPSRDGAKGGRPDVR